MSADVKKVYEGRVTEDYLVNQINSSLKVESYQAWHNKVVDFDRLYDGDFSSLFPNETSIPDMPLVENKLKNATHDLARLASEANGAPIFMRQKETKTAQAEAAVRSVIADTLWKMGGGTKLERGKYLDLIAAGTAAISVHTNETSDYPIFTSLNPRLCYPEIVNNQLLSMLYVETIKQRQAALLWPQLGLKADASSTAEVLSVIYYDKDETVQCVATPKKGNASVVAAEITDRWEHKLGMVPVGFANLVSADGSFHGLFDQLGGPMMIRNKTVRLLVDYLEDMAHAPFESKNVLNSDDEPGPRTVYQHDPNSSDSFIRRVAPATPAGAVFGLLQYMDAQESAEAVQPPARVGVVSQSIASGSFVASTQGTLSSVVKELQESMARLRETVNTIAMKIDERYLDHEKELWRAIGNKQTYTPSKDIKGWYNHTIQYGAMAGLNRAEADNRALQLMGAKVISRELTREQIDFIEDTTVEQNRIDREQLADVLFQRFVADPATPVSALATAIMAMGKGKGLVEVVEEIIPELQKAEVQAQQAAQKGQMEVPGAPPNAAEQQQALAAGGRLPQPVQFTPSPLQQQIVRNPT